VVIAMYDKQKKTVYLTEKLIGKIQGFADNTGLTWNGAACMILSDYFNEERRLLVNYLKGEQ